MTRSSPDQPAVRVFTEAEKRELHGSTFRELVLDGADFSDAVLQGATFDRVSLRGCDFRRADLRGAAILGCDLSGSRFDEALLGGNRFHGSSFAEVAGLSEEQEGYVCRRGGTFVIHGGGPRLRLLR